MKPKARGFTLIEVLIALVILAIALAAAARAASIATVGRRDGIGRPVPESPPSWVVFMPQ